MGTDFVVVYTGVTYGPAEVGISVRTTPPTTTMTEWETIEEGTFAVTGPHSLIPHPAGTETSIEDIAGVTTVDDISPGSWHIRSTREDGTPTGATWLSCCSCRPPSTRCH